MSKSAVSVPIQDRAAELEALGYIQHHALLIRDQLARVPASGRPVVLRYLMAMLGGES